MHVSVHAAKTHLSKLLEAVQRGETVVITKHDVPLAELVPVRAGKVRIGSLKTDVTPPPDAFLAPMSDDELADWGAA